jgi:hypothetical protein
MPSWRKFRQPGRGGSKAPARYEGGVDFEYLKGAYGDCVPPERDIVAAAGALGDYEESLWVLFRIGDRYSVMTDGHCSCNGWNDGGGDPFHDDAPMDLAGLKDKSESGDCPFVCTQFFKDVVNSL